MDEAQPSDVGDSYGVVDIGYYRTFFHEIAPAWLDHVSLLSGFAPPERSDGFTWCDLGCGQGVSVALLAATNPSGSFHGVDLQPQHVAHGRQLAAEIELGNAQFRVADFNNWDGDLPDCDYIVAHGVYSWVAPKTQGAVRRLIDRHLKPGGLLYLSYNAMPGWAAELPFQRLLRQLAHLHVGDTVERLAPALATVNALTELGAPALTGSRAAAAARQANPFDLAHHYMVSAWQPLFVTEVRAVMRDIGLTPAGTATLIENYDSFVLTGKARELLAGIEDEDTREMVRDYLIHQRFRRDVFIRDGRRIDDRERRARLMRSHYALMRPSEAIELFVTTPAGTLRFDNDTARTIVARLTEGPASLAELAAAAPGQQEEVILANALTLCAAGVVQPVAEGVASVARVNDAIVRRLGGTDEIPALALPCGTGLRFPREVLRRLCDPLASDPETVAWRPFLARQGVQPCGL